MCLLWYREALLVCSLTTCLALICSLWESSLGTETLDFDLPPLNQGDARFEWIFLVWLVNQSRVLGLQCITFFFFVLFSVF